MGVLELTNAEVPKLVPEPVAAGLAAGFCCGFAAAGLAAALPPATCADKAASAATIARKVIANLLASAFFSGTTQILPFLFPGTSRRATKIRTCLTRSALELRTKIELLRGSAKITVFNAGSAVPAAPVSSTLLKIAAISLAKACCNLIVCTSVEVGASIESINAAMR